MNIIYQLRYLFSKRPETMKNLSKDQLKKILSPIQYKVTQQNGTQPPFKNQYYNTKTSGIYQCLICNIPLFSSQTKFDSGCGWPAFYDQLKEAKIVRKYDKSHGMIRTEVRCSQCDSHLGHIFDDGPKQKGGVRYCINSASIKLNQKIEK